MGGSRRVKRTWASCSKWRNLLRLYAKNLQRKIFGVCSPPDSDTKVVPKNNILRVKGTCALPKYNKIKSSSKHFRTNMKTMSKQAERVYPLVEWEEEMQWKRVVSLSPYGWSYSLRSFTDQLNNTFTSLQQTRLRLVCFRIVWYCLDLIFLIGITRLNNPW